jgi:5-methylcytosine-specific restriction endonuclease McrA
MNGNSVLYAPVLVLNGNYEPLNVCDTRRALALLLACKADVLINGRGVLRSGSAEFELPSVIRLRSMVRRPYLRLQMSKREVLRRDNHTCQYCGRKSPHLTIDHVIPRHLGGPHTWENVVAACAPCNRRKGGALPGRVNMSLLTVPREPAATAGYRFGRYLPAHREWEPYLNGW